MPLSKFLPKDFLVSGGSITGLAAARVLRNLGHSVTVCERFFKPYFEKGRGVTLPFAIVQKGIDLGLFPKDLPRAVCKGNNYWVKDKNESKKAQKFLDLPDNQVGVNFEHLYEGLKSDFPQESYFAGSRVEKISSIAKDGSKYFVQTNNSGHIVDKVIGADGPYSAARRVAFPGSAPRTKGHLAWQGVITDPSVVNNEWFSENVQVYLLSNGYLEICKIPALDFHISNQMVLNWTLYEATEANKLRDRLTDKNGRVHLDFVSAENLSRTSRAHLIKLAHKELPQPIAAIIVKTPKPSLRLSYDFRAPGTKKGGIYLLGDAAGVAHDESTNLLEALTGAFNIAERLTADSLPKTFTPICDAQRSNIQKENQEKENIAKEMDNLCEQAKRLNLNQPNVKPSRPGV